MLRRRRQSSARTHPGYEAVAAAIASRDVDRPDCEAFVAWPPGGDDGVCDRAGGGRPREHHQPAVAGPGHILDALAQDLHLRGTVALLIGFPSAPFIIPLATRDRFGFLHYAEGHPSHQVHLYRTHHGDAFEWVVSPAEDGAAYELRFTLPGAPETWISDNEERKPERVWTVKNKLLATIMVYYRADAQGIRACQLRYGPGELRRA
jgi:hypothetical protein